MTYEAFLQGVANGRFGELRNRVDLSQILSMLLERKSIDLLRKDMVRKQEICEGEFESSKNIAALVDSVECSLKSTAQLEARYHSLGNHELSRVALMRFHGYSNREIADEIGKSLASVERKLNLIRKIWDQLDEFD